MGFVINDFKICFHIFVISEYQYSTPLLLECEEHNSDSCSRGNVSCAK